MDDQITGSPKTVSTFPPRLSLKNYWIAMLGLVLLAVLVIAVLASANAPTGSTAAGALLLPLGALAAYVWWMLAARLHDLGRTAWWALLLGPLPVIAVVGVNAAQHFLYSYQAQQTYAQVTLWLEVVSFALLFGGLLILGCQPGNVGRNRYGPDPVARSDAPQDSSPG
jgi:uncharacterized membrane protein YhaH (DUF805 family)